MAPTFTMYSQDPHKEYNFISYNKDKISKKKFRKIEQILFNPNQSFFNKPSGGLWACEYTPDEPYHSSWDRYLKTISTCTRRPSTRAVLFNIRQDAKIVRIDSLNDLKNLLDIFEITKEQYTCIYQLVKELGEPAQHIKTYLDKENAARQLNFVRLAEHFDGLYLSKEAMQEVTGLVFEENTSYMIDIDPVNNLICWSIESLLLFNYDCIANQKSIRYIKEKK